MKNIHQVLQLKSLLIQKKILWIINFVTIKFSLNALVFEKSWKECKNPSFLYKAMSIQSDHRSKEMRRCLSTFVTLYSRRLWTRPLEISFEYKTFFKFFILHFSLEICFSSVKLFVWGQNVLSPKKFLRIDVLYKIHI